MRQMFLEIFVPLLSHPTSMVRFYVHDNNHYYPTLLRRVQITRETSTNITQYLYSSHSPDCAKD